MIPDLPSASVRFNAPRPASVLADCRAADGDWRGGRDALRAAVDMGQGSSLRATSWAAVVRACEKAGAYAEGLSLMDEMRQQGQKFYDNLVLDKLFGAGVRVWGAIVRKEERGEG